MSNNPFDHFAPYLPKEVRDALGREISSSDSRFTNYRDDGKVINVYVDPVNGDDSNDGLSQSTAYRRIEAVYQNQPLLLINGSALIVNLINDSGSLVTINCPPLHLGGGGTAFQNAVVYRGPEMMLFTPASGPSTAALDSTPAVRVDDTGASSGTGNRTRLDFTVASPGWPVNGLRGSFLRVTRGAQRVFDEMPISTNTADTLTVNSVNIVGTLLATDTVEIVEPAIKLQGSTANTTLTLIKDSPHSPAPNALPDTVGASFQRLHFGNCYFGGVDGVQFDRCSLGKNPAGGVTFHQGSFAFKNTFSFWSLYFCANSIRNPAGRSDDAPISTTAKSGLTVLDGDFLIGTPGIGGFIAGTGVFQTDLPLYVHCDSFVVQGVGSALITTAAVGGSVTDGGAAGLRCKNGGTAYIPGGTLTTVTGPGGDLKVGNGAIISYGTGVGQFQEAIGWNGNFTRILEGTATAPTGDTSLITTNPIATP